MWLLKNLLFFVLTYICLTRAQSNIDDAEVMEIADSDTTTEDNENAQVIELLSNPLAENITNDIKKKLNDFPSLDNKTRESICDEIRLILESALAEQAECTTPTPPTTTVSTTTSTTPSTTPSTTTPRPPPPATARPRADCGFKKKCVLFWECEESIISRRGKYEFDLKKLKSCKHTLETCCPVNKIINNNKTPCPTHGDTSFECGYANSDGFCMSLYNKTNGEADFGQFPWAVTIRGNSDLVDGSLISDRLVLTASSQMSTNVQLSVRAGEWDRSSAEGDAIIPYQEIKVKEIIPHPDFHISTYLFDVAILVLDKPFKLMPHIRPICLSNTEILDYTKCIVTGWNNKPLWNRWTPWAVNVTLDCDNEEDRYTRICASIGQKSFKFSLGSALVCPSTGDYNRYYQIGTWSYFVRETETMFSDLRHVLIHDWIRNITNSHIN